ncbi:MAG: transcriptional regulatory protein [Candidatus Magnetoglobus multicellularis str. Araruama]|uniref:Transcriptional regulatory protein n=1 Tax=Candidatus Magnetoglobus multicellularis str. Araruama TaxID=890399 RepID=A0A1V1P6C2_9BACT|nr:MAG: transcriptional regulatory protein [Candidatus Magnetoglobus multicellularis str. Araruama]
MSHNTKQQIVNRFIVLFLIVLSSSCTFSSYEPRNKNNICQIFREQRQWYKSASASRERWGVPISVAMSIIYYESSFRSNARPPRRTCLFFFPGPRLSSAYGYAQAIDSTWKNYQHSTRKYGANRNDFHDAIDFVGWYCHTTAKQCGIRKNDAFRQYLAYHEGQKGYLRRSYRRKKMVDKKGKTGTKKGCNVCPTAQSV